jgi:hypothetical protein
LTSRGEKGTETAPDRQLESGLAALPPVWTAPEIKSKIAALKLLHRGAADDALRAQCLDDTEECLATVGMPLPADYSLQYVTDEDGSDRVFVRRGETLVDDLHLVTDAERAKLREKAERQKATSKQ